MLAQGMYGIAECQCFKAENLDITGVNETEVLLDAQAQIDAYFRK